MNNERVLGNPRINFTINTVKRSSLVNDGNNFSSSVKTFGIAFVVNVLLVKAVGAMSQFSHDSGVTLHVHFSAIFCS